MRRRLTSVIAVLAMVFSMAGVAVPAPGDGGDGGGQGGNYADLVIAFRDADGLPIVIGPFVNEQGEDDFCVQPITASTQVPNPRFGQDGEPQFLSTVVNPVDGRTVTLVPLFAHFPEYLPEEEPLEAVGDAEIVAPPDESEEEGGAPCDPLVIPVGDPAYPDGYDYNVFVTEVELERLNMARAPENVLVQHMLELELLLAGTDPQLVTLDPAGRITFDGVAIDAMPKLQGMREALLEKGTLPGAGGYPFAFQLVHDDFDQWSTFELTAFALGGAASKFGSINPDTVAYHDRIMNIAADWLANNPSGWQPQVLTHPDTGEQFVDYGDFVYDRATTFPGYVTYIDPANWQAGYQVASYMDVVSFPTLLPKLTNLAGYSQMANDAVALILFIHDYDSVIAYADPVGMADQAEAQRIADELNAEGEVPDPPDPPVIPADEADEMFFYRSSDGLYRYYNVGPTGSLTASILGGTYTRGWTTISPVDLDGDGQDEMFFYRSSDGLYRYYNVGPNGSLTASILGGTYTRGWTTISAVDLD